MKLIHIGNNFKCLIDIAITETGKYVNSKKEIYNLLKKKENLSGSYAFALTLKKNQIFLTRDKIGARKLLLLR